MTTENLIINGVDHAKFDLEWAKRGGVLMMTTGNVLALMKVVEGNYFLIADFFKDDDIGWRKNSPPSHYLHGGEDLRMAIPAECEAAGVEYIKRPVSDQSLSDLQQRAQAALRYAEKLRGIFHVSMLKAYPQKTHQEISDEIDNAMKEVK